jgi:pimeloyl-ACP methyl ester carboxylesterase
VIETLHIDGLTVLHAAPQRVLHDPVLFVHGYYADASAWTEWLTRFAAHGTPAYAVNLRGRSGSRPNTLLGSASISDFADDAAAVATHLGCPGVIGHSMGGLIAQCLAERGGARAAVLLTPAPPRGIPLLNARLAMKQFKILPQILLSRVVQPDLEALRALAFNCTPAALQDVALARMVPESGRAAREMSITGVPIDRARVRCPLLVVAAAEDRFIPARIVAKVAARYGAPLETVAHHGHMLIIEPGWEALADNAEAWLRDAAP